MYAAALERLIPAQQWISSGRGPVHKPGEVQQGANHVLARRQKPFAHLRQIMEAELKGFPSAAAGDTSCSWPGEKRGYDVRWFVKINQLGGSMGRTDDQRLASSSRLRTGS